MKHGHASPAQYETRVPNSASIPVACDICRERPVTMLIVDFIFACKQCEKRISVALRNGMRSAPLGDRVSWIMTRDGGSSNFVLNGNCQ